MKIVDGTPYIDQIKGLIGEYTKRLGRDLTFQNLEEELADLAKKYTAPEGELLAALDEDTVVGMVAYHRHSDDRCEMKRLYVTLVREIVEHASRAGYKEMVLDTIEPLQAAIHLYREAGFQECEPYYDNPMEDVIYFKKEL